MTILDENKWTILHHSAARSLEDLPDATFNELKKAIKEEEDRRSDTERQNRAGELTNKLRTLMREIEAEDFWVMDYGDKLDPSNVWVQY